MFLDQVDLPDLLVTRDLKEIQVLTVVQELQDPLVLWDPLDRQAQLAIQETPGPLDLAEEGVLMV